MTLRLRQICLVAPRLEPAVRAFEAVFGLPLAYCDPHVEAYGLENAIFVFGHQFIEVVAPTRDGTAVGRYLERSGGRGGYIVIFDTHDSERRRAHVEALGVRVVQVLDHPGYHGIQLHPRDCRAAMLEFDRSDGNEVLAGPYGPAGPHWLQGQRLDLVRGLRCVDVHGPDPAALAVHWARLIDAPLVHGADGCPRLDFELGALCFRPGAVERVETLHVDVVRPDTVLAAARAWGCPASGPGFELCGVSFVPHVG